MDNILDKLFNDTKNRDEPKDNQSIKEQCANNLKLFAMTYFPHIFYKKLSKFHDDMFQDAQDLILKYGDRETYFVRAAPRSFGKSRIISVVFPIWCVCYNFRKNILIISDTNAQAKEHIQTIKNEFENNEKLITDFGNLVGTNKWKEDEIVTANDVHIFAKSSGQSLRGANYNNTRPEVVILDDLECDEKVETETQRKKLYDWFVKVLMPIGNERTCFLYVGSILHYESLLYKVLHDPKFNGWNKKIYQAVNKFADNNELWEQWKDIYTDLSLEDASEKAYEFYLKNKEEMLNGVDILWPEWKEDAYYKLMIKQLEDDEAFNSEYQNNPMTEDSRIFKEAWLNNNTYEVLPEIKEVYAAVDPSLGKTRNSDTSAIIVLGRGIDNYIYVLEADICRRKPDVIIDDMIKYIDKYYKKLKGFVVETNVMQDYLATNIKQKVLDLGYYVTWIEVEHLSGDAKKIRISSMSPKVKIGYVKFNKTHTVLWNQLKNFPKGHDDGPDALQMALDAVISKSNAQFSFTAITSKNNNKKNLGGLFNIFK